VHRYFFGKETNSSAIAEKLRFGEKTPIQKKQVCYIRTILIACINI